MIPIVRTRPGLPWLLPKESVAVLLMDEYNLLKGHGYVPEWIAHFERAQLAGLLLQRLVRIHQRCSRG